MEVPKRTVEVFTAEAANVVNTSGQLGGCTIHIWRTPAASAATIVLTAAAALMPSTMSPTRSRVCCRIVKTCEPESFVIFSPLRKLQVLIKYSRTVLIGVNEHSVSIFSVIVHSVSFTQSISCSYAIP
jgi:hypothetical protein